MASVTLKRGKSKRFAAAEAEEPVLQFSVARSLSYRARVAWFLGLAAAGVLLQVAFLSVWPGLPFLLAAMLLSRVVGFDNRLDRRTPTIGGGWEEVPFDRLVEIRRLDAAIGRWDESAIDVTSGLGFFCFLFSTAVLGVLSFVVAMAKGPAAGGILFIDGCLLVLATWFSGIRTVFRQPDLVLKVKALESAVEDCREEIAAYGEVGGLLEMAGEGEGRVPLDAKASIRPAEPPDPVTGVQVQVVLNRVQGTPYPYLYAVVLAPKESGLLRADLAGDTSGAVVVETVDSDDVDGLVVRQRTTKTSGYHTKPRAAADVLDRALGIAAAHLARRARAARP